MEQKRVGQKRKKKRVDNLKNKFLNRKKKIQKPFLQVFSLAGRAGVEGKSHKGPMNGWFVSLQRDLS